MKRPPTVGILAFQGAFFKHASMLKLLKIPVQMVLTSADLNKCDALIIPGGESTTIAHHIDYADMRDGLQEFAMKKPLFGTCAGMILLAKEIIDGSVKSLGVLDICVERNAFGRQKDSFSTSIEVSFNNRTSQFFHSIFIRAPRIKNCGKGVKILAKLNEEPVLVQQNNYLAATFHPELTENPIIHAFFLTLLK
jgi:5'-phosphate synthase pdxT subunit